VSHFKNPAAFSQHIWTPFSTVPLFHLGHAVMEHFAIFIADSYLVFKKTNPNGSAENEVSVTRDTPKQCWTKIAPAKFCCIFPLFHCLEFFCERFQVPLRLLFL